MATGDGLGLFSGQQIERLVIAALREVMLDEAMDRAGNLTEQPGVVGCVDELSRLASSCSSSSTLLGAVTE